MYALYALLAVNPFSVLVSLLLNLLDLRNALSNILGLTYDDSYIEMDSVREAETIELTDQVLLNNMNSQILAVLEQNAIVSHDLPPVARIA